MKKTDYYSQEQEQTARFAKAMAHPCSNCHFAAFKYSVLLLSWRYGRRITHCKINPFPTS